MRKQRSLLAARLQNDPPTIGDRRKASWLHSPYPAPLWIVSDTSDPDRTSTIDFDHMMADGRSLLEWERLCATVREFAFYVRDGRYSYIDDASTHAQSVMIMMHLAHALTLRKLRSFPHLQPYDLEQIVEDCRYGVDAVLHASERVAAYLESLPLGGLPRYVTPRRRHTNVVSSTAVIAACNLPSAAVGLPCIATLIAKAAKANGMTTKSAKYNYDDIRPTRNVTVQAVQRWLVQFENLYAMRRQIEADAISFKPFPQGASRVAAVKGVGTHRTPTPPPTLAIHLLEQAARRVFNQEKRAIEFMDWTPVLRLSTACWIIIAGFSARRDTEIDDLRDGCISGTVDSGYWLDVYIGKTLQRKDLIPIPTLVARAVEVLSWISADARSKTGSDRLFQWCGPDGEVRTVDVGRYLDDFAADVQVPIHCPRGEPAVAWHWHPHQFRRFVAVLYFYRFESASIEVLAHFLRHFSLEMTKRYVTEDPEVAALWTDVEWGYMGEVARSIVAGERSVAGGAGERLKRAARRLIDVFRRKLQIVSPDRVGASLTLLMQRQGMVLTPKPWVTCSCPRTRAAATTAACRRQRPFDHTVSGPDFAHAGPTVCSNCPHAITEGSRVSFVQAEVAHLVKATGCPSRSNSIFGELEAARVLELVHVLDLRYDAAKPIFHPHQQ